MMTKLKTKTREPSVYSVTLITNAGEAYSGMCIDFAQEIAIEQVKKMAARSGFPIHRIVQANTQGMAVRKIFEEATEVTYE